MKSERLKILEMLQEGIISVQDAEKLLAAVDKDELVPTKQRQFKMIKIEIDTNDDEQVKIQIPIEFVKLLKGNNFNTNLDSYNIDIDSIIDMVEQGALGEIVNINTGDERVVIKVE